VAVSAGDYAPLSYTAEAIHAAHSPGTVVVFRIEAADQPTVLQRRVFLDGAQEGTATFESSAVSLTGDPILAPTTTTASWLELREHARFPAAGTERDDALELTMELVEYRRP